MGDRYIVVEFLNRGGYGRIYRAYDTVDRTLVAVKVWVATYDGEKERAIELETLKNLRGAVGCSQLYDEIDLPAPYRTAAVIPLGGVEVEHIKDPKDQYAAFCAACRSLYGCHQAGVIHRDIKPEQILFPTKFMLSGAVKRWFSENVDPIQDGVGAKAAYVKQHYSEIPTPPEDDEIVFSEALLIDARGWRHPANPNAGFIAPETLATGIFMPESDWWALGSTVLAWMSPKGVSPFETDNDDPLIQMQIIVYAMHRENTAFGSMRAAMSEVREAQSDPGPTVLDRFRAFEAIFATADPLKPGEAERIQYHKIEPKFRKMLKYTLAINPFRRRAFNK